ncbi:TIGR02678 family protein [Fervidibacillus halotolerans]|uniref:TIGR02678 family protein n=1 Tax=Fervidibacillus halotolerans TaxID=2980027 RepID=A0A9E8LZZ7_9BACI|nr:TIGR02678 family protein [Fervidibacillus halotolerans]WAA12101.1 TIGR02678 family protein [Fervidibacillus halotolerans]
MADVSFHFDEKAIQGLDLLFNHYWILRSEHPEWYRLIREREKVLRRYISDKFGLKLIIHQHFIKLEKIPVEPEGWMGIQEFQEPMDYAIFCTALAFLEGKSADEQFLLSELSQEIQANYPGEDELDWTLYIHRKSLIRAIKILIEFHLIKQIDGDLSKYERDEQQEVLYEATVYSRYFMRSYPDDFSTFTSWEDLVKEDWKLMQEDERRKRVYRKLFFSPGVQRLDNQDPDFLYIRNFRNRLTEDIQSHSPYHLHVYKNTAFLSNSEPKQYQTVFPDAKGQTDVILQLSKYLHDHKEQFKPQENGEIVLTEGELNQILEELRDSFGAGWTKYLRENTMNNVRIEVLNMLQDWMMAEVDDETSLIKIKPLMGVLAGTYPEDFLKGGK